MADKTSTGSVVFDRLLEGGYENDVITTVYGPAGSGKTLACLACAVAVARNKKVIYVDTEGGFSVARLKQLTNEHDSILNNIFFLKPTTFIEQKKTFEKLKKLITDEIGLIIVDSISMLYRLEMKRDEDISDVNKDLAAQVGYLTEIARKKNIPVLLTNQVYANFDDRNKVNIVGGDVLKYGSKCLIELQVTPNNKRRAILRKHRSISERDALFEIRESGMVDVKESKGFKLF